MTAPETLLEAAQAGIDEEKRNIAMYDELLAVVSDYPDLVQVFTNLQAASADCHLPAFEAAAASDGTAAQGVCCQTGCRSQMRGAGCAGWGMNGLQHGGGWGHHGRAFVKR